MHCFAGMSRSATFVLAYLLACTSWACRYKLPVVCCLCACQCMHRPYRIFTYWNQFW